MRILMADSFSPDGVEHLIDAGHEVAVEAGLDADTLPGSISGYDAVVVRSTKVTAETIAAADALGLIVRAGAGTNTIDKQAASDRGIYVCNVPGQNAIAVAELTMGLILALDRHIPDAVADLRAGKWRKSTYAKADGLAGKTLGLVGLGSIGLEVAQRAAAFDLHILVVDRPGRDGTTLTAATAAGVEFVASDHDLLGRSDIVSFHVPLTDDTRQMVNDALLDQCRPGTWIINTSRGEIVDEAALLRALDGRSMRAGLDVFADEPSSGHADFNSALAGHPQVYGTHHIGASTAQAQEAIAAGVIRVIAGYEAGQVLNCVNLETRPRGMCSVVVRHLNRVGVLSSVLGVLQQETVNVEQMENRILSGGDAAVASFRVNRDIADDLEERIRAVEHVISVGVTHEHHHA